MTDPFADLKKDLTSEGPATTIAEIEAALSGDILSPDAGLDGSLRILVKRLEREADQGSHSAKTLAGREKARATTVIALRQALRLGKRNPTAANAANSGLFRGAPYSLDPLLRAHDKLEA
jgi:hypothetical protein